MTAPTSAGEQRTLFDRENTDALLRSIVDEIGAIGRDADGATNRLAYSAEERSAHEALERRFDGVPRVAASTDPAGNRWITLEGSSPELPFVMTGSHLDSVPVGGMWDGALGVYSGAAALLQLAGGPQLDRAIALVAFASEESPRFAQSAYRFGSRAIAGKVDPADLERLADRDGVTLAEAMRRLDIDPARVVDAQVPRERIHALLELHIDQGLLLAQSDLAVSAVSAITGSCRLRVTVRGQADHSGAARMGARRDALAAAAELVLAAERIAKADPDDALVITVGVLQVEPGSVSVVPGLAEFTVDIRSVEPAKQNAAQAELRVAFDSVAAARGVEIEVATIRDVAPIVMSDAVTGVSLDVLAAHGLAARTMPSHAGHDTGSFAGHPRLGMLFVRNSSGRSHSRDEQIEWRDAVTGTEILRDALARLATTDDSQEETS